MAQYRRLDMPLLSGRFAKPTKISHIFQELSSVHHSTTYIVSLPLPYVGKLLILGTFESFIIILVMHGYCLVLSIALVFVDLLS